MRGIVFMSGVCLVFSLGTGVEIGGVFFKGERRGGEPSRG